MSASAHSSMTVQNTLVASISVAPTLAAAWKDLPISVLILCTQGEYVPVSINHTYTYVCVMR